MQLVDEDWAFHHHSITSLGVFDGSPFVVGSGLPENKEVEHFRTSWSSFGQFPFVSRYIYGYSTVTVDNELYIFGKKIFIIITIPSSNIIQVGAVMVLI